MASHGISPFARRQNWRGNDGWQISEGAEVKTSVEIYIKKITINHIRTNGAHESISTPVAGGKFWCRNTQNRTNWHTLSFPPGSQHGKNMTIMVACMKAVKEQKAIQNLATIVKCRTTYPNKLLERCWFKWIEKNSIRITPRLVGGARNPALSGSKQIWWLVVLPSTQKRVTFKTNIFWCNKLFSSTRRFKLCTRTFGTRVTSWNWRDLGCSPATASTVPPVTNSSGHLLCRQQALMTSANQCCFVSSTIYNLMWCVQISLGKASLLSASAFLRRSCFFWRL